MTAGLFMVQKGDWVWAVFLYVMGIIGFSGANIFYDSLLLSIADKENIDYISGLGYSMGYFGGGLLFLLNVLMVLMPGKFAAILGPVLMGSVGLMVRWVLMPTSPTPEQVIHVGQLASRCGIASIALLFIVGAILFSLVDEEKGKAEAVRLSEV